MKKKLEFILDELIKNYLKIKEPISSSSLKKLSNLDVSASTIRGYFKSLEKLGMIEKEHFSSGSYPTKKAMEFFWRKNIPEDINFSIKDLEIKAKEFDIAILVEMFENELLNRVYNFNDKFIILEFENNELVFRYSDEVYIFLKSLENLYSYDLLNILSRYKLDYLLKKFEIFQKKFTFNQNLLYNKLNEVDINFLNQLDKGFLVKDNILIKKFLYSDENNKFEIVLVGDIYSDFLGFFDSMKGGENE